MATPKSFPTLVQLEQREGTLFEVLGNLTKPPYWFHSEYLKSPKAVHLEAWLVEAIFGEWAGEGRPMLSLPAGWPCPRASYSRGPGSNPVSSAASFPKSSSSRPLCFLRRPGRRAHPARRVCVTDTASH